uniref:Variant surface glycoprotein 1678 n=1 Tax=Trypanosoma brucei TaxID=5691 RepID=M4SW04_9TRYP|nr:variant surface glycoprotein 1678 [Trypanosoma brucei]
MRAASFALAMLAYLTHAIRPATSAADANAQAHGIMCRLQALAAAQPPTTTIKPDKGNSLQAMLELNLTTSDDNWRTLFDTKLAKEQGDKMPAAYESSSYSKDWSAKWQHWWSAAKRAEDAKTGTAEHSKYKKIPDEQQRRFLHSIIEQNTAKLEDLQTQYNLLKEEATQTLTAKIQKELNAALYGGDGTKTAVDTTNTLDGAAGWTTTCGAAKAGRSIIGDFLCLCNGADGGSNECPGSYAQQNWGAAVSTPRTTWPALKATCPQQAKPKLSSGAIAAAIASFESTLGRKTSGGETKVFLGSSQDHSCDGTSSRLCVSYDNFFAKTTG